MRTFPRALATFRRIVEERGAHLRNLTFEALQASASLPIEHLSVDSRPATIALIVEPHGDDTLRVVVQGFMDARLIPGQHVALDGFYKRRDGTVAPMPDNEFHDYD